MWPFQCPAGLQDTGYHCCLSALNFFRLAIWTSPWSEWTWDTRGKRTACLPLPIIRLTLAATRAFCAIIRPTHRTIGSSPPTSYYLEIEDVVYSWGSKHTGGSVRCTAASCLPAEQPLSCQRNVIAVCCCICRSSDRSWSRAAVPIKHIRKLWRPRLAAVPSEEPKQTNNPGKCDAQ